MNETEIRHTPGPWRVKEMSNHAYPEHPTFNILAPNPDAGNPEASYTGADLAVVYEVDCRANAKLIAAAPELLEALELAEATIVRLDWKGSANGTLDVIRAAIAKARGEA